MLRRQIFILDWFFRHLRPRCRRGCCGRLSRCPTGRLELCCLPKPTGEQWLSNTKSREASKAAAGPGPSTSSRKCSGTRPGGCKGVPPDLYLARKVWIASISSLHGRHVNIKYEPYRLSGCPADRLKEPIAPWFTLDFQ